MFTCDIGGQDQMRQPPSPAARKRAPRYGPHNGGGGARQRDRRYHIEFLERTRERWVRSKEEERQTTLSTSCEKISRAQEHTRDTVSREIGATKTEAHRGALVCLGDFGHVDDNGILARWWLSESRRMK